METFSVDVAAAVTGFPRGTLGVMVTRGYGTSFPCGIADLCSLMLAKRLVDRGLVMGAACAVAWGVRDLWQEVMLADAEQSAESRNRYVAVGRNPPGDPVPYTWLWLTSIDELVGFFQAPQHGGVAFAVDATAVCRDVFTRLLEFKRVSGTRGSRLKTTGAKKSKRPLKTRAPKVTEL